MWEKRIDDIVAFVSGDLLAMVVIWVHLDTVQLIYKLAATAILGAVGGFMGLAGKDLYMFVKNKITKWRK